METIDIAAGSKAGEPTRLRVQRNRVGCFARSSARRTSASLERHWTFDKQMLLPHCLEIQVLVAMAAALDR